MNILSRIARPSKRGIVTGGITIGLWMLVIAFYTLGRVVPAGDSTVSEAHESSPSSKAQTLDNIVVRHNVQLGWLHPTFFKLHTNRSITDIAVNGQEIPLVTESGKPGHHPRYTDDWMQYLHSGINVIDCSMSGQDSPMLWYLYVSPRDPLYLGILALSLVALAVTLMAIHPVCRSTLTLAEMWVIFGALAFRWIYVWATPYFIRSHDEDGHIQYVDYIFQYVNLPSRHLGWETFQPPLYYAFSAVVEAIGYGMGFVREQIYGLWQLESFVLSCLTVFVLVLISRELFSGPNQQRKRVTVLAIMVCCPSLMFNASRINNDVLYGCLGACFLLYLIRFWKTGFLRDWLILSLCLFLLLLTKASALLLMATGLCVLAFHPQVRWKEKGAMLAVLLFGSLLAAGWFYVPSLYADYGRPTSLVANITFLPQDQRIPDPTIDSMIFDPVEVIKYPFVYTSGPRRDVLLEYEFKSAFFGQWHLPDAYKWAAQVIVLPTLLLLPVFFYGLMRGLADDAPLSFLMALIAAALFFGQWVFVQMSPYQSSEDFRYSSLLCVPIAFLTVSGIKYLPSRFGEVATGLLISTLAATTIFWIVVPFVF